MIIKCPVYPVWLYWIKKKLIRGGTLTTFPGLCSYLLIWQTQGFSGFVPLWYHLYLQPSELQFVLSSPALDAHTPADRERWSERCVSRAVEVITIQPLTLTGNYSRNAFTLLFTVHTGMRGRARDWLSDR